MAEATLSFGALRSDWFYANDIVPRHLVRARAGERIMFDGFPAHWLPLIAWCGGVWANAQAPERHLPLVSDAGPRGVEAMVFAARSNNELRTLVEAVACLDPVLADALYIVDQKAAPRVDEETLWLTSWASYGRPAVRLFERRVADFRSTNTTALFLPCSRRRPYDKSNTHKRIWTRLEAQGIVSPGDPGFDHIVLSSIGIVPRAHWDDPVVQRYDAGVPDIYRLLRLLRAFLKTQRYHRVVDCLSFEPYSDLLRICQSECLFAELAVVPKPRVRRFYVR
ncbi:MAG: DUF5591 domain-containing protein [Brevundimonas sp.]|uniref:DUF5591 domain-containing protein n=1 Tax=Brevundimonas sp. TaxID=1871086 RepID=UPI002AB9BDF6|nr:DUF5591 domain-containing protein [Brevundimonas sp.]MDZ4110396.1 DUF5591 domain-containing protein [Brevundimonas sp.]